MFLCSAKVNELKNTDVTKLPLAFLFVGIMLYVSERKL